MQLLLNSLSRNLFQFAQLWQVSPPSASANGGDTALPRRATFSRYFFFLFLAIQKNVIIFLIDGSLKTRELRDNNHAFTCRLGLA